MQNKLACFILKHPKKLQVNLQQLRLTGIVCLPTTRQLIRLERKLEHKGFFGTEWKFFFQNEWQGSVRKKVRQATDMILQSRECFSNWVFVPNWLFFNLFRFYKINLNNWIIKLIQLSKQNFNFNSKFFFCIKSNNWTIQNIKFLNLKHRTFSNSKLTLKPI